MDNSEDYNTLSAKLEANRKAKKESEEKIEDLGKQIDEMKKCCSELKKAKEYFKDNTRKKDKDTIGEDYDWEGETYDSFEDKGSELLQWNENFFLYSLDDALDKANLKKAALEVEKSNEEGVLASIVAGINYLLTLLKNIVN